MDKMTIREIKEWLVGKSSLTESEVDFLTNDTRAGVKNLYNQWNKNQSVLENLQKEHQRLLQYEEYLWEKGLSNIVGIDEVGRGPLAGPVVAAAVILPKNVKLLGLRDSKKLSSKKREELVEEIKEVAITFGIGMASAEEIDALNIYDATKLAMEKAVKNLSAPAEFLLVDAMTLPLEIPQKSIIKGDDNSLSIAAASVLAKVTRDQLMEEYDIQYPGYQFHQNSGYGTQAHLEALRNQGPSPIHRMTFSPVRRVAD